MTKPKLSDAVKQPSEKLADNPAAAAAAADSKTGVAAGGAAHPPAGDKGTPDGKNEGDGEDPGPESGASASNDKPPESPAPAKAAAAASDAPAPAASGNKTLADYKAAFGDVQGCVYFAEGMDFASACAKHIAVQGKQITDLKAANETLTTQVKSLAKEVGGNAEPLKTGSETAKGGEKSQIDQYASLLESKLAKLS